MPMPPRMFATLLETPGKPTPQPGDLVLVEVPLNCTIHDADAARIVRLRLLAAALSRLIGRGRPLTPLPPEATPMLDELLGLAENDTAAHEALDPRSGPDYGVGDGVHQW